MDANICRANEVVRSRPQSPDMKKRQRVVTTSSGPAGGFFLDIKTENFTKLFDGKKALFLVYYKVNRRWGRPDQDGQLTLLPPRKIWSWRQKLYMTLMSISRGGVNYSVSCYMIIWYYLLFDYDPLVEKWFPCLALELLFIRDGAYSFDFDTDEAMFISCISRQ